MKELLVRLTVKGAMFGNLIDFHGELFESQIVSVLKHKYPVLLPKTPLRKRIQNEKDREVYVPDHAL